MKKTKYVVGTINNHETGLMFPDFLEHKTVARQMRMSEVVGAGFVDICVDNEDNMIFKCYGKSTSLDVSCRGEKDTLRLTLDYVGLEIPIGKA